MKQLIINSIKRSEDGIVCGITENGVSTCLWVKVEEQFREFLCDDRADGFFIICLYKAIKEGYDLISKVPVSERLYYQAVSFMNRAYAETFSTKPVKVDVPFTNEPLPCAGAVGTGISMGVDSLYTVATHCPFNSECPPSFYVSHLVLMNAGAFVSSREGGNESFIKTAEKAKSFCDRYGYQFVSIDTNILEFIPYWQMEWHGIVNGSVILSLQKLFSTYYSSSSYKFNEFKFNPADLSQAELFNLMVLSTDNTKFYSTGGDVLRIDKVKLLTQWAPSYDYLQVCAFYSHNCSEPTRQKCGRTMVEIDVFNALDKYSESFDISRYQADPNAYIDYLYARRVLMHDHYVEEMWSLIAAKYPMGLGRKCKAIITYAWGRLRLFGIKGIIRKLKHN